MLRAQAQGSAGRVLGGSGILPTLGSMGSIQPRRARPVRLMAGPVGVGMGSQVRAGLSMWARAQVRGQGTR